jgi:hypothetical protein
MFAGKLRGSANTSNGLERGRHHPGGLWLLCQFYAMNEKVANVRRVSEGQVRNAVADVHVKMTRGFRREDAPRITL